MVWDALLDLNKTVKGPWIVAGDFNVVLTKEEK